MVVQNSVPLSFFESTAFLQLNREIAKKLDVQLGRENIRTLIINAANIKKLSLKNKLESKLIHLKMDACTRQRTNYFGINVQFVDDNDKICINTIAVKDTKAQHGSDFLKTLIIDVLREYDIKFQQILSIVTDNASNMKTTIDKLNLDESLQNHKSNEDNVDDEEIVIDLETEYIALASQLKINHMRCAAHTLQLAIRDGLKEVHATQLIGKIRNIVVILRNPKIDGLLKRKAGKGAIIDQPTRWGSTFVMIKRFLELKPFISDLVHPDIVLTEDMDPNYGIGNIITPTPHCNRTIAIGRFNSRCIFKGVEKFNF
nr:uncharacterized protein LOC111421821 [Onthophagus taurus]